MLDLAIEADAGVCEKAFGFGAIESRMYAGDKVQGLRNSYPARQNSNVSDEADIAHQRITPENSQLAPIWNKTEDCVQCSGLARTVRTNHSEDAALLHAQVDAGECDGCAERFAQA